MDPGSPIDDGRGDVDRPSARRAYYAPGEPDAHLRTVAPEVGWRLCDVWVAAVVSGVPCDEAQAAGFAARVVAQVVAEHPDREVLSSRAAWAEFEAGQTSVLGDDDYGGADDR